MEFRLYQKVSGCVVVVFSHRLVLLTVVSVQIAVVHLNRPATAAGLTLPALCGFQKSALRITCFLNRSMDWRGFHQLVGDSLVVCVVAVRPELASSATVPTATLRSTSPVHRWPASTWRWLRYDSVAKASPVAVPLEQCARRPSATCTLRDCLTTATWLRRKWKHYWRTRCDGLEKFWQSDDMQHLSFLFLWYPSKGYNLQITL